MFHVLDNLNISLSLYLTKKTSSPENATQIALHSTPTCTLYL